MNRVEHACIFEGETGRKYLTPFALVLILWSELGQGAEGTINKLISKFLESS